MLSHSNTNRKKESILFALWHCNGRSSAAMKMSWLHIHLAHTKTWANGEFQSEVGNLRKFVPNSMRRVEGDACRCKEKCSMKLSVLIFRIVVTFIFVDWTAIRQQYFYLCRAKPPNAHATYTHKQHTPTASKLSAKLGDWRWIGESDESTEIPHNALSTCNAESENVFFVVFGKPLPFDDSIGHCLLDSIWFVCYVCDA